MGNKGDKGIASAKAQAQKIFISGEQGGVVGGGGASGGGSASLTLTIRLIKLNVSVLSVAKQGATVTINWNGTAYEALLDNAYLGTVPSSYNEQLMQPASHRGRIEEVTQQPPVAVIEVKLRG